MNISYTSCHQDPSGYGDAARNFIGALWIAGVNITTENVKQTGENTNFEILGSISKNLENRKISYNIKIIHLTPDLYPKYLEQGKYHIGHLFWETSKLPPTWVAACNEIQEIWTASEQQAEMMKKSGVKVPIYWFPQPIDTLKGQEHIQPFETQYEKDFYFYSIFQWIPRKNPRALLRAYWKTFEDNDKVTLLLKTYRISYSDGEFLLLKEEIASLKKELNLGFYPKIYLIKKLLTSNEMWRLHQTGDCFVSPSSGEGFNRPAQEAMLLGKPIISGNNGGITDLLSDEYYYKVKSSPVPVTVIPQIPWYQPPQEWLEVDENDLGRQMLNVYREFEKAKNVGARAKAFITDNFSWQKVGNQMKERLEQIYSKL